MGRLSSENEQWAVRDVGIILSKGQDMSCKCVSHQPRVLAGMGMEIIYAVWCPEGRVKTKDRALGKKGHKDGQETYGKVQENWKFSRETRRI